MLRPGGGVLLLEVTKPERGFRAGCFRAYFKNLYPAFTRHFTRSDEAKEMMLYFWETMDAFVPPAKVLASLSNAGFDLVRRRAVLGMFSEYTAIKPPTSPPLP